MCCISFKSNWIGLSNQGYEINDHSVNAHSFLTSKRLTNTPFTKVHVLKVLCALHLPLHYTHITAKLVIWPKMENSHIFLLPSILGIFWSFMGVLKWIFLGPILVFCRTVISGNSISKMDNWVFHNHVFCISRRFYMHNLKVDRVWFILSKPIINSRKN